MVECLNPHVNQQRRGIIQLLLPSGVGCSLGKNKRTEKAREAWGGMQAGWRQRDC